MTDPQPQPRQAPQPPRPQRPPPIPPQAIHYATPGMTPRPGSGRDDYQRVADTVGMVPSLRWKDNLIQGLCVLAGTAGGAGIGALMSRDPLIGAFFGGILGLVTALFVSGIVLMILGFIRARRR